MQGDFLGGEEIPKVEGEKRDSVGGEFEQGTVIYMY